MPTKSAGEVWGATDSSKFESFLEKLGSKDRVNIERHLTAIDEEPTADHARLWKRLMCTLSALAPHALQTSGQRAVRFFVADGKYRMQAFALEDPRDQTLAIYATDVLDRARKKGILGAVTSEDGAAKMYSIGGDRGQSLRVEPLSNASTDGAPEYYRHMTGWNRKAVRITLPITASQAQVKAAEALCALSVESAKAN